MKTDIHFWSYLAHFFSEWEIFKKNIVDEIKHTFCVQYLFFLSKIVPFWDNVEKYCRVEQATDDNMAHAG